MRSFRHTRPDEIIVRTAPDFLQEAFRRLRGAMKPALDAGYDVSRIYLILDEILSNMYKHGYGRREGEPIGVHLRIQDDVCVITARDLAPTFDSARHACTRVLPDPEAGAPGGRGLVIVNRLCESFEHSVTPEGGNVLRLVMKLVARRDSSAADLGAVDTKKARE